jgi:YesN/AraC family two-component response regulator
VSYSIYIVDDELPIVQRLVSSIPWLEHGFEVVGYSTNPQTAIAEIISLQPDVVFTDLKMPGCDGLELLNTLKENGIGAEFVMLSSFDEYQAVREFFLLGGVDYILKPLDHDNAALVLEKLSRKLASTHNLVPSVQFVSSKSQMFDDLIQYITEHFNKKHTLHDLSCRFNMNQTYICDLFSKQYNSTLTIFVSNLRMREASRLILENEVPIKEIAAFCGYRDYHQFAKAFKLYHGVPPSKYREGA